MDTMYQIAIKDTIEITSSYDFSGKCRMFRQYFARPPKLLATLTRCLVSAVQHRFSSLD